MAKALRSEHNPLVADERAILDTWREDDSIYVDLQPTLPLRQPASAGAAELAAQDAPASEASLPLPTPL